MAKIELYDSLETKASFKALEVLAEKLPKPCILLGGWAVYFSVNERFQKDLGFTYLGSRDVDLGFHISKDATEFDLITGNLVPAIHLLRRMGYRKKGASRFCRTIDKRTGETIVGDSQEQSNDGDLFHLYIDPIVDYSHPKLSEFEDIDPLEEPVLSKAVLENRYIKKTIGSGEVNIPEPDILLEMKLRSFPKRTKPDKIIKDICDIYSLIWFSEKPFLEVISPLKETNPTLVKDAKESYSVELGIDAARHLGIESDVFEGVIKNLFG